MEEQVAREAEGAVYEVHADAVWSVVVFASMRTQWRVAAGMAFRYLGLDYAAIPAVLDGLGILDPDLRRTIFADLRVMESAALPILNAPAEPES